jgi:ferredoxin--NADP+ reductase
MEHYDAVIYATGAQTDKSLGIPGEDLPGSWPATEFVAWYNGHPDYRGLEFDLSHERAVVIGNGNVAADVVRILTRSVAELERTDIADHALEALRQSRVTEVVVLGRRGAARAADGGGARRIVLRFLRSPVEIRGADGVEAIDVRRNEIVRADDGMLRPRPVGEDVETIECGLVLRSVGYRAVPLPDVPFDEHSYVLPNDRGRVRDMEGNAVPGVYAVGWIKRGPTGILGTNKRDAEETVDRLAEDLASGALKARGLPAREEIGSLIGERKPDVVTADGWHAIDARELQLGVDAQRPRVKLASRDELLAAGSK